jgi:hypothetical protein
MARYAAALTPLRRSRGVGRTLTLELLTSAAMTKTSRYAHSEDESRAEDVEQALPGRR